MIIKSRWLFGCEMLFDTHKKERFVSMVKIKRLVKGIAFILSLLFLLSLMEGCGGKPQENVSIVSEPSSSYTPPTNGDGYIVVTFPITLSGGNSAKDLAAQHQAKIAGMSKEEIEQLFWSDITANRDGSFNYIFTPEQFQRTKEVCYMAGKLIDRETNTFPQEFIKATEYADVDEGGIPRTLVVSVDRESYESFTLVTSYLVTLSPAVYIGMYQVLCGVPGDEWAVHVIVKDADTGEVISEHDFPTRGK